MRRSVLAMVTAAVVTLCLSALAWQPVSGQAMWDPKTPKLPMAKAWAARKATLRPYTPPRTPDGVPDFQGRGAVPAAPAATTSRSTTSRRRDHAAPGKLHH